MSEVHTEETFLGKMQTLLSEHCPDLSVRLDVTLASGNTTYLSDLSHKRMPSPTLNSFCFY